MGRRGQRATVFNLQLLLHTRLSETKILFIGLEPSLVGILERRRQRRHDLATVTQVATDFRPFFRLANRIEATARLHCFFQFEQIQGTLVDTWETVEVGAMLFMKLGQLVEVVQICARS